ncbi:MAG: DUF1460 domain-containing protein [Chromatiales bacterium]|jgi:hypothetical protein
MPRKTDRWRQHILPACSVFLLCAALSHATQASESRPEPLTSAQDQTTFEKRLDSISARLLGKAYLDSPLGEGQGIDPDPLIRFDAFDCTTYVETVLASALADSDNEIPEILNKIRYSGGIPSFATRRHLPEFQWLADLHQQQVLSDITAILGGPHSRSLQASISPAIWAARQWRIVHKLDAKNLPEKSISLPYIPLKQFHAVAGHIRQVALLSVVRQPREDAPLLITHHALLVPVDGQLRVRHASPQHAAVVEEAIEPFLRRLAKHRHWPVLGLNVMAITGKLPE